MKILLLLLLQINPQLALGDYMSSLSRGDMVTDEMFQAPTPLLQSRDELTREVEKRTKSKDSIKKSDEASTNREVGYNIDKQGEACGIHEKGCACGQCHSVFESNYSIDSEGTISNQKGDLLFSPPSSLQLNQGQDRPKQETQDSDEPEKKANEIEVSEDSLEAARRASESNTPQNRKNLGEGHYRGTTAAGVPIPRRLREPKIDADGVVRDSNGRAVAFKANYLGSEVLVQLYNPDMPIIKDHKLTGRQLRRAKTSKVALIIHGTGNSSQSTSIPQMTKNNAIFAARGTSAVGFEILVGEISEGVSGAFRLADETIQSTNHLGRTKRSKTRSGHRIMNNNAIGMEHASNNGNQRYTWATIQAGIVMVPQILERNPDIKTITGHSNVIARARTCPGEYYPWEILQRAVRLHLENERRDPNEIYVGTSPYV